MTDIFDNAILCKKCNIKMKPIEVERQGFVLRAIRCDNCGSRILHPKDEAEYENFQRLKTKTFSVKMRMVGNSYAVSIPREIVDFMREQEKVMDDIVRVAFDEARKLSLMFGED